MGIKELTKLLKTTETEAVYDISADAFCGQHIIVDAYCFFWRYFTGPLSRCEYDPDKHENLSRDEILNTLPEEVEDECRHNIESGLNKLAHCYVTFIFDGEEPDWYDSDGIDACGGYFNFATVCDDSGLDPKFDTRKERQERQESTIERIKKRGSGKFSSFFSFNEKFQRIAFDCLSAFEEYKVIFAGCEADWLCALYANEGRAMAIYTSDTDILAYGCNLQIIKAGFDTFEVRYLPDILRDLSLTEEKFTELCILLGCDYNKRIRGVGQKTALKICRGDQKKPPEKDLLEVSKFYECKKIFASAKDIDYLDGNYSICLDEIEYRVTEM